MAQVDDEIEAAGARIIWVLQQDNRQTPGTADLCYDTIKGYGADRGICVGDGETAPITKVFHESPFAIGRGFDLILPRDSMVIEYVTTHGTPSGNENLDGQAILEKVRDYSGR